ncbi:MAG: phage head-tail joining protein [Hyphomonadaceae bacterium]
MALDLSTLQSLKDALVKARLSGVREIRDQNGETVSYKSDREMASALSSVESQIAALQSAAPNVIKFKTSKGI